MTGEKGEKGATPVNIKIDLTNEVSSVAADFYGTVPVGAVFETTQVLLYDSADQISFSDPRVTDYSLKCDGVTAEISSGGLVTVTGWDPNNKKDTGSVTINVIVDQATYTTVYTIQKVRAGSPGADATLYKIIPDMNVVRRVNGKPEVKVVRAYVMKTQGSETDVVSNLALENLKLLYSLDNEEFLEYLNGVTILDTTRYIIFKLVSASNLSMYDRETVTVVESSTPLTVDLDNEISAVPTTDSGTPIPGVSFEPSNLRVFYGGQEIDIDSCEVSAIWTNLTGTLTDGCIQPTAWHITDNTIDYGSVLVSVSYLGMTKSVVYTVRKLKSGVTPVVYKLVPSVSVVKGRKDTETLDTQEVTIQVAKTYGADQTTIEPANIASEGLRLSYVIKNQGVTGTDTLYDRPIPVQFGMDTITVSLRDASGTLVDRETIPVVYDGESRYTYIVYARSYDEVNGPGLPVSETWGPGFQWIGICNTNQETRPTDYSMYTWSRFVGQDGKGQEYIFCRADSPNDVYDVSRIPTNADATYSSNSKAFQDDEFLPSTSYGVWTDDPQEVTDIPGQRAQWISMRSKTDGIWGSFSVPKLWNSNSIDLTDVDTHLLAGVGIAADSGRIGGWQINEYVQNPVTPIPKNGSLYFERPVNETIAVHNESGYSGYSGIWFNPVDKTSDDKVTPKLVVSKGYVDDSASHKAINDMITIDVSGISMGTYGSGKTSILRSDGSASLAGGNLTWSKEGTLELTGKINAASGTIGGWTIGSNVISKGDDALTATSSYIGLNSSNRLILLQDNSYQESDDPHYSGEIRRTNKIKFSIKDDNYYPTPGFPFKMSGCPTMELTTTYLNRIGADFEVIINPCGIQMSNKYSNGEWIDPFSEGVRNVINTCISSLGFGWLAKGNFSWDTSGNLYGPDTTYEDFDTAEEQTIKAWELLAGGSMKFNNGLGIKLNSKPGGEGYNYTNLDNTGVLVYDDDLDYVSKFRDDGVYLWSTGYGPTVSPDVKIANDGISVKGFDSGGNHVLKVITWEDLFSFLDSKGATITTTSVSA